MRQLNYHKAHEHLPSLVNIVAQLLVLVLGTIMTGSHCSFHKHFEEFIKM